MKKYFFTYIVLCADGSYYVGVTNDPELRVMEHNSDNYPNSYCHHRRPVSLVFCRDFEIPEYAIAFEKQLKGWSRAKKLALINNDMNGLHLLSKCKNITSHSNTGRRTKEILNPDKRKGKQPKKNIKPAYLKIKKK